VNLRPVLARANRRLPRR